MRSSVCCVRGSISVLCMGVFECVVYDLRACGYAYEFVYYVYILCTYVCMYVSVILFFMYTYVYM